MLTIVSSVIFVCSPILGYVVCAASGYMAFISQTEGIASFLFLVLFFLIFFSFPTIFILQIFKDEPRKNPILAWVAAACTIGLLHYFSWNTNLFTLWAAASGVGVFMLFLALKKSRRISTPVTETKEKKTPTDSASLRMKRSLNLTLLMLIGLTSFWLLFSIRELSLLTLSQNTIYTFLIPVLVLCMIAGIEVSKGVVLIPKRVGHTIFVLASGTSIVLVIAVHFYHSSIFPALYTKYYAGEPVDFLLYELIALFCVIPVFFVASFVRPCFQLCRTMHNRVPTVTATLGIALVLFALLAPYLTFRLLAIALCSNVLLIIVLVVIRTRIIHPPKMIWLAVLLVPLVYQIVESNPGMRNLFDPSRFEIEAEQTSAAGTLTLVRSRDYDDPFRATIWNETQALTQNSKSVSAVLARFGHLPMLLKANPTRSLVLGYGSGSTLQSVVQYRPEFVQCVEATSEMLELIPRKGRSAHGPFLEQIQKYSFERPWSFVSYSKDTFDVIISPEPLATPFPSILQFSESYFHNISRLLDNHGVFAQWLPVLSFSDVGLRRIMASIQDAFPSTELWLGNTDIENPMLCVIGRKLVNAQTNLNRDAFEYLLKDKDRSYELRRIGYASWADVLSEYAMDGETLRRFIDGAKPLSEFEPMSRIRSDGAVTNAFQILSRLFLHRTEPGQLLTSFPDSIQTATLALFRDRFTLLQADAARKAGDDTTATRLLFDCIREHPFNTNAKNMLAEVLTNRATTFVSAQQYHAAIPLLGEAVKLAPLNTFLLRLMMIASMQIGDKETAALSIDGLKRINPRHAGFRDNQATIRAQQGAIDDALLLYENAITLDPKNEEFYCNMASLQFQQGRIWEAIRILDNATEKSYYPAKPLYLKGTFYMESKRPDLAREAFVQFLAKAKPDDARRIDVERTLLRLGKK